MYSDQLLNFLGSLEPRPEKLIAQLKNNSTLAMGSWMKISKDTWEKYYELNGILIYDFLHSQSAENERYRSIEDILDAFCESNQFRSIKTASEDISMEVDEKQGSASAEVRAIMESPLLDRGIENILEELKLKLPYKRLPKTTFRGNSVTVLVGVSGCGKSRTCIDVCSERKALYYEADQHVDFKWLTDKLVESKRTEADLGNYTKRLLRCLLLSRLLLLERLDLSLRNFRRRVSLQKSVSFQNAAKQLAITLHNDCADTDIENAMNKIIGGHVVVFDEAQELLNVHVNQYPNSSGEYNRPLFRFMVDFVSKSCGVPSFWCGTQLRLKDVQLASSAAAGGKPGVILFTDFQFYTFNQVQHILRSCLGDSKYEDVVSRQHSDVLRACYYLQGRPRLVTTFLERFNSEGSSFSEVLNDYLEFVTNTNIERVSFKWFWRRVYDQRTKLSDLSTGLPRKTPDQYCFDLLAMYILRTPNIQECSISIDSNEADLLATALISLKKVSNEKATFFLLEPAVMEGAVNLMLELDVMLQDFMKHCVQRVIAAPQAWGLSPDGKGKMLDRFIALRFRLGWWRSIPEADTAWDEVPQLFHSLLKNLPIPRYVAFESVVSERFLEATLCSSTSDIYVSPAEKSGPDGCYRFICYNGKSSFTWQNEKGDMFISFSARKENLLYTDLDEWFGSIKNRNTLVEPLQEMNTRQPILFLCTYLPVFGPRSVKLPAAHKHKGNWIIHLDLTSRLCHYMLGEYATKQFCLLVSELQKKSFAKVFE